MSRAVNAADIAINVAGEAVGPGVVIRYAQSANIADLEARVNFILNQVLNDETESQNFLLTHVHVAGGGSGHTFVCVLYFGDLNVLAGTMGLDISATLPFMAFFTAADAQEIGAQRVQAQARAGANFTFGTVIQRNTWLAGAQQGTKYVGGLLFSL